MQASELTRTLLLLAASIIGMTYAASLPMRTPSIASAALAFAALTFLASGVNGSRVETAAADARTAARSNTLLMVLTYGWGGLAMLSVYLLSGLKWQHGWQYGSGMLLIAAALFFYAHRLKEPSSPLASPHKLDIAARLTLAQAIAASIALIALFASGKIGTPKNDWAANHIFVAGGLAIVVISLLAFLTHRRLTERE